LAAGIALLALAGGMSSAGDARTTKSASAAAMPNVPKPMAGAPYWNAKLPVEQRVADLLARMTLEEKIAQITALWENKTEVQDAAYNFDPAKASQTHPNGIGTISRPSDTHGAGSPRLNPPRTIENSVAYVNAVQTWAREHTRLGIPVMFHEESLHGINPGRDGTAYPQAIGLASTWDPDLLRAVNAQIAGEIRPRGVQEVLSPVVDVARDPRWGRIEETFGEDPYLVGELGVAAIEGLQGVGTSHTLAPGKVLATLKHMTGHGQPESGTNTGPAPYGERTLREFFFPPFEQAVKRTGIQAVMASYNEIDGIPSHSNVWLLKDVLRGEWGYKGAVVSDYYAIADLMNIHHIAPDLKTASELALKAGVAIDLPSGNAYAHLGEAVKSGELPMSAIDSAVSDILTLKFNAGLFENPWADLAEARKSGGPEGVALARKAAEKELVLLKNDGTLPLALPNGGAKPTIAVIGPNAAVARLGGYYGLPRSKVSPLDGIRELVGNKANIVTAQGVVITKNDDWWEDNVELGDPAENARLIAQAVETAKNADTILLFIGDTEQTSREGWATNHLGDRAALDLVGEQNDLFNALKALGKPIVAVLVNGRPPSYPTVAAGANAILETWYGGQEQGHAIADALFGRVNPGGKLPVTVARDVGQLPMFYDYKPSAHRGYLFGTTDPLFPFGYGLSYTTFDIGAPVLASPTIKAGEGVSLTVPVTNTGKRAGDEVVQVYLHDDVSSVTRPVQELAAFQRVTLQPGETKRVTLTIRPESLSLWNREMKRVIEPGTFTISSGPDSHTLKSTTLTVTP